MGSFVRVRTRDDGCQRVGEFLVSLGDKELKPGRIIVPSALLLLLVALPVCLLLPAPPALFDDDD